MVVNAGTIYLPLDGQIDLEAELAKLNKQKAQLEGWIKGSRAKLSNRKFLEKAPKEVVDDARTKLEELAEKLSRINDLIATLQ